MAERASVYCFTRGQPGLFVEIYFPKRVDLQGTIFTFGYLVRRFSEQVLNAESPEDEIWVTSLSNLTLNVIGLTK